MEDRDVISEVVGESYPNAVEVGGRLRRNWVIRTTKVVPGDPELQRLQTFLEEDAAAKIRDAYAPVTSPAKLPALRPVIRLVRLDAHHLVIRTEFAKPQESIGAVAAISQWGVLQTLGQHVAFDELQGLPCHYWFPLRSRDPAGKLR